MGLLLRFANNKGLGTVRAADAEAAPGARRRMEGGDRPGMNELGPRPGRGEAQRAQP